MRAASCVPVSPPCSRCALAGPAAALPPTRQTITQHNVVEDQGQACGFPVRWTIDLTVDRTRYFDADGNLVKIVDHVREDNTVENLATGLVLREGPDAFQQVITFEGVRRGSRSTGSP